MPARLPAPLIHLLGVLRPRLLRPDVRAPSIAHVDFAGLKGQGFNAVVIDKDNCITLPHADTVFPAYASAWQSLLDTFPGRVLVVSNSAGSSKDRGGIGAESLALSLRAPVLAHKQPKPACSPNILAFFAGLTKPTTKRAQEMTRFDRIEKTEDSAEKQMVDWWCGQVISGPLCGPLTDDGKVKMLATTADLLPPAVPAVKPSTTPATTVTLPDASAPLRILVIGDRLFTDTLLARRLDLYLTQSPEPQTLSIQTTDLPQPNDVRSLRWLEDWLAGPTLAHHGRAGGVDWSSYTRPLEPQPPQPRWLDTQLAKLDLLKKLDDGGPPITWDPRTWRPKPVLAAVLRTAGEASAWVARFSWSLVMQGVRAAWTGFRKWLAAKRVQVKEGIQRARHRRELQKRKARLESARAAKEAEIEASGLVSKATATSQPAATATTN